MPQFLVCFHYAIDILCGVNVKSWSRLYTKVIITSPHQRYCNLFFFFFFLVVVVFFVKFSGLRPHKKIKRFNMNYSSSDAGMWPVVSSNSAALCSSATNSMMHNLPVIVDDCPQNVTGIGSRAMVLFRIFSGIGSRAMVLFRIFCPCWNHGMWKAKRKVVGIQTWYSLYYLEIWWENTQL